MGPLEVTDVTASSCHLKWKPPEDDGGVPVDYYQVNISVEIKNIEAIEFRCPLGGFCILGSYFDHFHLYSSPISSYSIIFSQK